MDRGLAVVLTAAVGGLVATQAPVNSHLGRNVGTFQAATFSFLCGTIVLALIASLAAGGLGSLGQVRDIPIGYLTGGLLGAAYVTTVLVTVRTLGAGGVSAATITGQLGTAVVIDHFGLVGVDKHPISVQRIVGVALLIAGTFLIVRD